MKVCRFLLSVCVMLALGGATAAAPTTMKWTIDGVERQGLVFLPTLGAARDKVPVVFGFHGHGGNARGAARAFGFERLWPRAIVVYLEGLPTASRLDPQGTRPGWQTEPGEVGDRDLKLVDAVLGSLHEKYSIDDSRIYAAGFSNGAFFTYLLWAERAPVFAAFGPVAGRIRSAASPNEPRPLVHVAGENDPLVKIEEQLQTIETARQVDGATGPGQPCGPGCTLFPSTKSAPVLKKIHPGGHVVPPGAGELIVKFFKAHPKP